MLVRFYAVHRYVVVVIAGVNGNKKTPLAGCSLSYSTREVYAAKAFGYSGGSGAVIADQTNSGEFFVFRIKRFLRKSISPSSRILPSSTDKPLRSTDR